MEIGWISQSVAMVTRFRAKIGARRTIDRRIISVIQGDGKITVNELAERVGLSPSPCARRVRLMEEAGIIKGYAAIIDQKKVGLPISAFASIKLERQREEDLERFARAVSGWPEVVDCYLMTGQRDYLMRIVAQRPRCL
jgi:Lrp/AsnC family leucine-responsive transcriptional regulator